MEFKLKMGNPRMPRPEAQGIGPNGRKLEPFKTAKCQISLPQNLTTRFPMGKYPSLTTWIMEIIKLIHNSRRLCSSTVKDAGGDDTKDSDPDSDGTVNVTIKDDDDFTIDMGIYTPKASIGDFVWDDVTEMEFKMKMSQVLQMLK